MTSILVTAPALRGMLRICGNVLTLKRCLTRNRPPEPLLEAYPREKDGLAQNRASLFVLASVIQKFNPSLHAPKAAPPDENVPIGVRSDAFHNETLPPLL